MNRYKPPEPRSLLPELTQFLKPGILGFYTHVECTELFANQPNHDGTFNVFTLLVAEERSDIEAPPDCFLTPKPIRIKSLKDWSFGLRRYTLRIDTLIPALKALEAGEGWKLSGDILGVGKLLPMPAQFVPPDYGAQVQWNKLLKNNYWTGSHLFEWTDQGKEMLTPFFADPRCLQQLSEQVEEHIPIRLAAMSDRIGNLAVQLPVTVLRAKFQMLPDGNCQVEHAWHPKAAPRPLIAVCELEHDDIITGFASARLQDRVTPLPMRAGRGLHRGFVWDEQSSTLLVATGPSYFLSTISFNVNICDPEPRIISIKNQDGSCDHRRVDLIAFSDQSLVGNPQPDDNGGWTAKRMYTEQANRLAAERRFVQYRPTYDNASHQKALDDLRELIIAYGEKGAWLWDPYLSANDLLETLFYCPYQGVDLRCLTMHRADNRDKIRQALDQFQSNWRGLKLELRMQKGPTGWKFHDRFLIFPSGPDGAMAWSLGTSVNSVGKAHHILQKVDNAQLVVDAFTDLWELLSGPDHLIWKKP